MCLQFRHRDISNFSDRNLLFSVASRDLFFYTQASGDYIGMAIRSNVLFCVYKLGGVVHEVETVQITTTSNVNSSDFDRVVFHRYSKHRRRKRTRTLSLKVSRGTEPHFPPPPSVITRLSVCVNTFCRVYQDAEVKITQHFTSQESVSLYPKRNLPNTTTGVLQLDPESLVFYVGGYPHDFEVPSHCGCFIIPAFI